MDINIGDGKLTAEDSNITLSAKKKCDDTGQSLIDATYPGISHIVPSERAQDHWFSKCTIVCAQNDDADSFSNAI